MSVIGPRPLLSKDVECMNRTQQRRHEVRPGLTGLAQCSGRNSLNWDIKLTTDVRYVDNISAKMDIDILLNTILKVLKYYYFAEFLNLWSYKQFQKPIFNGRDDIWLYGFRLLGKNPLFGTGNMNFNNWHNSAIVCLTAYGAIGYILWIGSFNHMLNKAQAWLEDYIVQCLGGRY